MAKSSINFYFTLMFMLLTQMSSMAQAGSHCVTLVASSSNNSVTSEFKRLSLETLLHKLAQKKIYLDRLEIEVRSIDMQLSETTLMGYEIAIKEDGRVEPIGTILVRQLVDFSKNDQPAQAFQTHIGAHGEFKGTGIGTLLYLLAAQFVYKKHGFALYSSRSPSPDAERTWNRMKSIGWTETVSTPFWGPNQIKRFGSPKKVFRFRQEILEVGTLEDLTYLLDLSI